MVIKKTSGKKEKESVFNHKFKYFKIILTHYALYSMKKQSSLNVSICNDATGTYNSHHKF